jgi:hypothetical protein
MARQRVLAGASGACNLPRRCTKQKKLFELQNALSSKIVSSKMQVSPSREFQNARNVGTQRRVPILDSKNIFCSRPLPGVMQPGAEPPGAARGRFFAVATEMNAACYTETFLLRAVCCASLCARTAPVACALPSPKTTKAQKHAAVAQGLPLLHGLLCHRTVLQLTIHDLAGALRAAARKNSMQAPRNSAVVVYGTWLRTGSAELCGGCSLARARCLCTATVCARRAPRVPPGGHAPAACIGRRGSVIIVTRACAMRPPPRVMKMIFTPRRVVLEQCGSVAWLIGATRCHSKCSNNVRQRREHVRKRHRVEVRAGRGSECGQVKACIGAQARVFAPRKHPRTAAASERVRAPEQALAGVPLGARAGALRDSTPVSRRAASRACRVCMQPAHRR